MLIFVANFFNNLKPNTTMAEIETLLQLVKDLTKEVADLKAAQANGWLDVKGLINYLPEKPAPITVYTWVSKREIPHYKNGKFIRFLQSEIDEWIKAGRRKTNEEIAEDAARYLSEKKKGGKSL